LGSNESARPIKFVAKAVDGNGDRVAIQVMYKKSTETSWHNFGRTNSVGPDGKPSIKNGLYDSNYNTYGWKPIPNGVISGRSNYDYISMAVNLGVGTWQWRTRAIDSQNAYGDAWSSPYTINITKAAVVQPPVAPPAPPTVTTPASKYTYDNNYQEDVVLETEPQPVEEPADTQAPSVPVNLKAEYKSDSSTVDLVWDESSDNKSSVSYEIEREVKGTNGWGKIGMANEPIYSDFQFEPNNIYSYRVISVDESGNKSDPSAAIDITISDVKPNVTISEGGEISDAEGNLTVFFPEKSVAEDLFVAIEPVDSKNISAGKGRQISGAAYDIRAKNNKGEEVTEFKSQVKVVFNIPRAKSSTIKTGKIGYLVNDNEAIYLSSFGDTQEKNVWTLTDHFTVFFLSTEKASVLSIFLKIILSIMLVIGVGVGGYYGYNYYQQKKYQKEHQEDYIYRH